MKRLLTLLLLLAPSVLAQNPVSGGPIPQTTYQTLPNNLGVPNGTTVSGSDITFPGKVTATGNTTGGNLAVKPATSDSNFYVSINGNDLNDGFSWGSAYLTIAKALTSVSVNGGQIHVGCGTFAYSTVLTFSNPGTMLSGSGWGYTGGIPSCTVLQPSAGTVGIIVTAGYVTIENLTISSAAVALGTDDCVQVTGAGAFTARNVFTANCGRRGFYINNSVIWELDHAYTANTREDGIRIAGTSGSGMCNTCSAGNSYGGWGINTGAGNCTFINPYVQFNAVGGIQETAGGDQFIGVSVDASAVSSFVLTGSANKNNVQFDGFANATTITDSGTANVITYVDSSSGYQGTDIIGISPFPGSANPTTWIFDNGRVVGGTLRLRDYTNSIDALNCVRVTALCTFGAAPAAPSFTSNVATGTAPLVVTSTTPVANLSLGGGAGTTVKTATYSTNTNCSSSASPAVCGSAAAGSVAVPTGVTPTLVVNTTAVTANSQILFTPDESLGTKLSVTCNSTIAQVAIEPIVTARTAATSFTIQYNTTITVNPICLSYWIIN